MRFKIDRNKLLEPLQAICTVVEKKQTLPILSHIHILIQKNKLRLAATDLEVELVTETTLISSELDGAITVPAKKLLDICRNLSENTICEFYQKNDQLVLITNNSKFSLSTLPANQFPNMDTGTIISEVILKENDLKKLLEKTHFAMAQQDVRYYLNGLLFEISGDKMTIVATDGHRLAISNLTLINAIPENINIIIPRKGVLELLRLLNSSDNEIKLQIGNNFVTIIFQNLIYISKLIEGRFPNYKTVIPKGGNKTLTVNKDNLRQALNRASILSHDKHHGIRAEITETIQKIFAMNSQNEESEEEISVAFTGNNPLEIGLNINYLQDVLSAISSSEVKMTFTDSNSSILIEANTLDDESLYVIMPMRL
jgi:DNA polymerase-3 subunit beta